MRELKTLELAEFKDSGSGPGEFEGRASTFNTVDSYKDSVAPGAYVDTLPDFLKRGFISWHHNWADPIAMVTQAEERSDGLWIKGIFHSDPEAQKYRTRVKERMAAGLFTGLSIGYEATDWEMKGDIRVLKKIKLFEVSIVSVPAEANSGLSTVKGHGLSLEEHAQAVRDSLAEFAARIDAGIARDIKAGRAISAARMRQFMEAVEGFEADVAKLRDILAAVSTSGTDDEDTAPIVGLDSEPPPKAALPPDLAPWVERFHKLNAIYASI